MPESHIHEVISEQQLADKNLYCCSSLRECLEYLAAPLARDHFMNKDPENRNSVTISDIITGIGTEDPLRQKARTDQAIRTIPEFVDEIDGRNCEGLGTRVFHALLNVETDSDESGVPLDQEEDHVCRILGRILLRIQVVSPDRSLAKSMLVSIMNSKQVFPYQKYKVLKACRSAMLALSEQARSSGDRVECGKDASLQSRESALTVRSRLADSIAHTVDSALKELLSEETSNELNDALFGDFIETLALASKIAKDCYLLEPSVTALLRSLRLRFDIDRLRALLQLLLSNRSTLDLVCEDDDLRSQASRVLEEVKSRSDIHGELRDLVSEIHRRLQLGN